MGLLHIHLDWRLVTGGREVAGTVAPPPSAVDLYSAAIFEPAGIPCLPPTRPDTNCTGDAIHPIAPSTAPSHSHRAVAPRCARSVRPSPASREADHHGNTVCTRVESETNAPR